MLEEMLASTSENMGGYCSSSIINAFQRLVKSFNTSSTEEVAASWKFATPNLGNAIQTDLDSGLIRQPTKYCHSLGPPILRF